MSSQTYTVTGMVLSAAPVGDYDKLVVLLTRERGKIRAFARGARRPGSALMAAANYFGELMTDFEGACYGQYFLEFADYYTRENADGSDFLKLAYQSLRALLVPSLPRKLVRYIYELKAMTYSGECPQTFEQFSDWNLNPSTEYALQYVVAASVEKLYTFLLTEEVFAEFARVVTWLRKHYVEHRFKSLEILETCL